MQLSVIIPVYNSAPFLHRSLGSVCASPVQDMEIICVNDGSSDDSAKLLDKMAAEDPRIRVIHQENSGVSAARNAGMDAATGDYICFVDGDDSVEPDFLPELLAETQSHPLADCIIGGHCRCSGEASTPRPACTGEAKASSRPGMQLRLYAWGKLYRTAMLREHGIRFAENVSYGEDTLFTHMVFPLCREIILSPSCGYSYHACPDSLSSRGCMLCTGLADATRHLACHLAAHPAAAQRESYLTDFAAHALRRIRSMAPHRAQRTCAAKVRDALQKLSLTPETLPDTLSDKNRRLLQKVLCGSAALGPWYYWKRLTRLLKRWSR